MKTKGFSLVEALIATLILIVGILGALRLNMVGLLSAKKSILISKNVFLGQSLAEQLISTPFEELDSTCNDLQGYHEFSGDKFYVSCLLVEHSDRLKQVLLRIFKNDISYNLSIYISEGE